MITIYTPTPVLHVRINDCTYLLSRCVSAIKRPIDPTSENEDDPEPVKNVVKTSKISRHWSDEDPEAPCKIIRVCSLNRAECQDNSLLQLIGENTDIQINTVRLVYAKSLAYS